MQLRCLRRALQEVLLGAGSSRAGLRMLVEEHRHFPTTLTCIAPCLLTAFPACLQTAWSSRPAAPQSCSAACPSWCSWQPTTLTWRQRASSTPAPPSSSPSSSPRPTPALSTNAVPCALPLRAWDPPLPMCWATASTACSGTSLWRVSKQQQQHRQGQQEQGQ